MYRSTLYFTGGGGGGVEQKERGRGKGGSVAVTPIDPKARTESFGSQLLWLAAGVAPLVEKGGSLSAVVYTPSIERIRPLRHVVLHSGPYFRRGIETEVVGSW